MANNHSFTDYVVKQFYNELYKTLESYMKENKQDIKLRLYKVNNIDSIGLDDITVKFVNVSDLPGMDIEFDVIVEAKIEVREQDSDGDKVEKCKKWFVMSCSGNLDCKLEDFAISSISIYDNENKPTKSMSDTLVPIIYKDQFEEEAEKFLKRNYEKALLEPIPVDPMELVENMGLTVRMVNITKDTSIFGRCYFADCETELYDIEADSMVKETISSGTILVDKQAYFLQRIGTSNNTIVHECVHWDKHRKSFALARLYDSSLSSIGCEVNGGIQGHKEDSINWMEWQANVLAPKIQMPLEMFKIKTRNLISEYRSKMKTYEIIDIIEPVIDQLALHYGVSRTAAKIRMIDAGYEEALGAFNYIDGLYVKPHKARKGYLKRNNTFCIAAQDAANFCSFNTEFKNKLEENEYQYIDSHFVINNPKYVEADEKGNLQLTHYARNHMDECCIVFEMKIVNDYRKQYHNDCFLNKDEKSLVYFDIAFSGGYENSTPEKRLNLLDKVLMEEYSVYELLPNNFVKALEIVIDWKNGKLKEFKEAIKKDNKTKITAVEIADRTGLNEATVRRTLKGEKTSTNTLVLICLALHLPYNISKHIIDHSPTPLFLSNPDHRWYDFILQTQSRKTVDEVKNELIRYGAAPL